MYDKQLQLCMLYCNVFSFSILFMQILLPVHVHGALSLGGLSHGSCPHRRSEAWGCDNMVSDPMLQAWA